MELQFDHNKALRLSGRVVRALVLLAIFANWLQPRAMATDLSFLKGMVDGCIDGQRRMHAEQKIPFDAALVREYCYCEAPNMADLLRTAESRDKLRVKAPQTVAAIQQITKICTDGVLNGRKFAPPIDNASASNGQITSTPTNSGKAQVGSNAPMSFDAFSKTFRCPESLPNDQDREFALRRFLNWTQQQRPDLTVSKIAELRTRLLEEHHCDKTLANIRVASTAAQSAADKHALARYEVVLKCSLVYGSLFMSSRKAGHTELAAYSQGRLSVIYPEIQSYKDNPRIVRDFKRIAQDSQPLINGLEHDFFDAITARNNGKFRTALQEVSACDRQLGIQESQIPTF